MSSAYAGTALVPYSGTISGSHVGHEQHGHYGDRQSGGRHDGRQNGRSRRHDETIRELRMQRKSIADIAASVGVTQGTVVNALRRLGMQGRKFRAEHNKRSTPRERISTLETALEEFGGLYIEAADMPDGSDGYLVTINNEFPGMACTSIAGALRSAIAALGDRECARGGRA